MFCLTDHVSLRLDRAPRIGIGSPLYLGLITGSFVFGIACSCLGSYASYYSNALTTSEQKAMYGDRMNFYVRLVYRFFLSSVICLMAATGQTGYNYYPKASNAIIPQVVGWAACAFMVSGPLYLIMRAHSQTQMDDSLDTEQDSKSARTDDADSLYGPISQTDNMFGTRAVFVAGFSLAACTRYNGDGSVMALGYVICCVTSVVLALCCTFLSSLLTILSMDLDRAKREQFARSVMWASDLCPSCFFCSILLGMVGVGFAGWGTGYEYNRLVPAVWAGVGCLLIPFAVCWVQSTAGMSTKSPAATAGPVVGGLSKSINPLHERMCAQMNLVGSQATITAGFVFYAIVTFHSDIEGYASRFVVGQKGGDWWPTAFLHIMSASFVLDTVAAVISTLIGTTCSGLSSQLIKDDFAARMKPLVNMCFSFYHFSLFLFMIGFGLLGRMKFSILAPLESTGMLALCFFGCGKVWVTFGAYSAKKYDIAGDGDADESEDSDDDDHLSARERLHQQQNRRTRRTSGCSMRTDDIERGRRVSVAYGTPLHSVIRDQIGAASSSAIFVGGFAYLSVNFFNNPDAPNAHEYLWLAGLVFGLSMVCVTYGTMILVELEDLGNEVQEEIFAKWVLGASRMTYVFFTISVLLLYQSCIHMGHAQLGQFTTVTKIGGWIGFGSVFLVAWTMPFLAHRAKVRLFMCKTIFFL